MIDRFVILIHNSTVYKGCSGCFIYAVRLVYMAEQMVARVDDFYLLP